MLRKTYLFRNIRASDAHSHTDVSLFQSRGVVDAIACDSHNGAKALAAFYNDQLLLWRGAREYNLRVVPGEW